ncbi:hypothetical protein MGYG_02827 [Nannizzia gypsea CBS 118893]|uniref:Uncharacterized protein n=1 Tax=Arthroderma gypseum (strain ATCC MYA-4604 / CBS 118893) TaxID=535722 RepID=E4UP89_ARTGP|nr:hypothetical protein MGYG_02827 [Nannizzia gypsea CBS 118893]EFQ99815.1 hypothetical protein MGYG_02827 [Nannizzia gypsea CBS 118893]
MSSTPVSAGSGQYVSLFNPGEIQSNQEAQYAVTGGSSSHSGFENDENLEDDHGQSETHVFESENTAIPFSSDIGNSDDEEYGPPSSFEEMERSSPRMNKFHGPPSTWRSWTKRERNEFAALETIQSRDLSIHLYNSFVLKNKAKKIKARALVGRAFDGASIEAPYDSLPSFAPNRGWTAWPMPADEVPRADERINRDPDDTWTISMAPDDRPSAELEECIIAHMMRISRQRFDARPWDWRGAQRFEREGSLEQMNNENPPPQDENGSRESVPPGPELHPVTQVDDEESRRLLRPEARNILEKLDGLLLNLQAARNTCTAMSRRSIKEQEPSNPRTKNSSLSDEASSPSQKSLSHSVVESEDDDDGDGSEGEITPNSLLQHPENNSDSFILTQSSHVNTQKRPVRFGLRDWSEILGVASLTGWPTDAVLRASRRCADLFGEDQVFTTMDEGRVQLGKTDNGMPCWKHTDSDQSFMEAKAMESGPIFGGIENPKQDARYCPVAGCPRQLRGFSRAWNLNQHLKKAHADLLAESKVQLAKRVYK